MCKFDNINVLYESHPTLFNVLGLVVLALLAIIIILLAFWLAVPSGKFDNDGLVIAFLGVLATFIVIGNFAQTSRIEDSLNKKIGDLEKRIQTCETNNETLANLSIEADTLKTEIEKIGHNLQEAKQPLDKKDLGRLLKLFVGREGDVRKYMHLYAKFLNPDSKYMVEYNDGAKEQITITYSTGQNILNFVDSAQCLIESEDIAYLSGVPFNEMDFIYAYQLLNEIDIQQVEVQEAENKKEDQSEINKEDQVQKSR